MNRTDTPLLCRLGANGPISFGGDWLASLLIEVRGGRLEITGQTPVRLTAREDIEQYEYRYTLEGAEAERLLAALRRDFGDKPERVLASEFEFTKQRCPLFEYLDRQQIQYEYHTDKGGE